MELRAAVLVSIALTNLCAANVTDVTKPKYFRQKLDHFDPDSTEYFEQRYYKYDRYFREGGPIFLQIRHREAGGIGHNFPNDFAVKNHGLLYAIEHRYYGESVPASFSGGSPRYLSTEQALEDIAQFIEAHKEQYPHSPWIVYGCSYAGNLATWMRLKYPHLVHGAIAGSAPVLAKADFYEYFEVLEEVIKKRAPLCHQKIVEANQELATLAQTDDGQRELARIFGVPSYSPADGLKFHFYLANAAITKIALPYFLPYTSEVCDSVTRNTDGKSTLEMLVSLTMPKETPPSQKNTTSDRPASLNVKMFVYLMCHEFGYFRTLSSNNQSFGVWRNVNVVFRAYCNEFNISLETLEENIRETNLRYGGKTPNVTNVVFMHGSDDPWHPLGVLSDLSSSARAFIFQGLYTCEPLRARETFTVADERLPEWMNMFDEIESIVRSWF